MRQIWAQLGGGTTAGRVRRVPGPTLTSSLPVMRLAHGSVQACARAAAQFAGAGAGRTESEVVVDDGAICAAFLSERLLRVDGRAPLSFAPLSRFWRTEDGWLRTHANYPHHRARLLRSLGLPETLEDPAAVTRLADMLRGARAEEVEETVFAAGGLAVAVRDERGWRQHPQGAALASLPLVARERLGDAAPLGVTNAKSLRVLDLTRVIAGPVATRTLAFLGADVLRLDAPWLPDSPDLHIDTGFGKRSAWLDLSTPGGERDFRDLLAQAHVVVTGYRPGSLEQLGLSPAELAERRPGLVIAQLNAWGTAGPWAPRRGFDSLVQAASGIAHAERDCAGRPGALPAQALDHASGYLLAAGVLRALTEQLGGATGSPVVRVSLGATAHWLLDQPADVPDTEAARTGHAKQTDSTVERWLAERSSPLGRLRYARSPVSYVGGPTDWSHPPTRQGSNQPRWLVT